MTVEQAIAEAVRQVVREEVRAALAERSRPAGDTLSTEEAAELAGVTPKTIRAWVAEGLPAQRHRRRLVIRRKDLETWRAGTSPEAATLAGSLTLVPR